MSRVLIIGGGAAGMMAAVAAAEKGHQVALYEKNDRLGKKVFITGKGRCNVTNACEVEDLFQNVMTNPKFLYSAFYSFDNRRVMDFFEQAGCPLKIERGERVFPVSDHSSDVIAALNREMKRLGVDVYLNREVAEVLCGEPVKESEATDLLRIRGIRLKDGKKAEADSVIVATGGISYVLTGSTGDGYRFAKECGHTVTKLYPSLVPFTVQENWCRDLMGLSLRNVSVELMVSGKEIYSGFGEMLFTHYGVSGPLILSASSYYVRKAAGKEARLRIDLKPALTEEQLDKRILRDFEENNKKQFKNALHKLFPAKLIPIMIQLSGIDPEQKVNEISKEDRKRLVQLTKYLELTMTGIRDYNEAIITKGGVSVKEINPSTMESKRIKGLYFAGEVLDLDALTGGFNLQIAWSTGHLAGSSIE